MLLALLSVRPDATRRKECRPKPVRVFSQSLGLVSPDRREYELIILTVEILRKNSDDTPHGRLQREMQV